MVSDLLSDRPLCEPQKSAAWQVCICRTVLFCMLVYCGASVVLRALQGAENRTYPL